VECCDESVQCSFTKTKTGTNGTVEMVQTGYVDVDGPSAKCTGGARRTVAAPIFLLLSIVGFHWAAGVSTSSHRPPSSTTTSGRSAMSRWLPVAVLLIVCSLCLHGCDSITSHTVGNWRSKPSYLNTYRYVEPGKSARDAILNSCAVEGLPATQQCSGHGYCKTFSTNSLVIQEDVGHPLAFCSCEPEWADMECSSPRKSQMTAWLLSVFLGWSGADYFYLGFPLWGMCKLLTLGGLGFWWLVDIVRISSGPVYAYNFRTANDLTHWAAMVALIGLFLFCGFFAAIESFFYSRKKKREDLDLAHRELSHGDWNQPKWSIGKGDMMPSYGSLWGPTNKDPRQGMQTRRGYPVQRDAAGMQYVNFQEAQYAGHSEYATLNEFDLGELERDPAMLGAFR